MVKRSALALLFVPSLALAAPATHFAFGAPASEIGFTAVENGVTVHGHFASFSGEAQFDPAAPASGYAKVSIDLASVASDSANVADNLKTPDWFDVAHFPKSVFEAHGFKALPGGHYEADGTLTLKGKALPVTLDFAVPARDEKGATVNGTATLSRTHYGVGWTDTGTVADAVTVTIALKATAAK